MPTKLVFLFLLLLPLLSGALESDREKPIEIEADQAQIDEKKGITHYKGNAILTQGTLRIQGDRITFYYDENHEIKKATAQGKLATYQQILDLDQPPVKARALQMEYYAREQKIYLIGKAYVQKKGDVFSGKYIEYDIKKNVVTARSTLKPSTSPKSNKERIHIIIQPPNAKKKSTTGDNSAQEKSKLKLKQAEGVDHSADAEPPVKTPGTEQGRQ